MAINIVYKNKNGEIITEQQRSVLTTYSMITYIDDSIKKIEGFELGLNGDLKTAEYFLDLSEDKTDILQMYKDSKTQCNLYFNSQSENGFTLWDLESYSSAGVYKFKGNCVYDSTNKPVMCCYFDLKTNVLLGGSMKFSYADKVPNRYDDILLLFEYDVDGNIESISDYNDNFGFNYGHITLDEFLADTQLSQADFPWDQHPYFHKLLPYLPESTKL